MPSKDNLENNLIVVIVAPLFVGFTLLLGCANRDRGKKARHEII